MKKLKRNIRRWFNFLSISLFFVPMAQAEMTLDSLRHTPKQWEHLKNISVSEFAYQQSGGQSYVTLAPMYIRSTSTYKTTSGGSSRYDDYNTISKFVNFRYSYSFNDKWNLKVDSVVGDQYTSRPNGLDTIQSTGFSDINFVLQRMQAEPNFQWYWGPAFRFSPGEQVGGYSYSAGTKYYYGKGNLFSGGHTLGGVIGYQRKLTQLVYGTQLNVYKPFAKTSATMDASGSIINTQTGGNSATIWGFAEWDFRQTNLMGFRAGFTRVNEVDINTSISGVQSSSKAKPIYQANIGYYGKVYVTKNFTLVPRLQYMQNLFMSQYDGFVKFKQLVFELKVRVPTFY